MPPEVPHRVLVDLGLVREEKAAAAAEAAAQVTPDGITGAAARVLELVRERSAVTTSEAVEALRQVPGCGATAVKAALRELRDAGLIVKPGSLKAPWRPA